MTGDVSRGLVPFARRDALVRFVKVLLLTAPLGAALLVAAVRYGFPTGAATIIFLAASAGAAAVIALVQRRSPRELAAHIDRRHRLQNRVAAALEVETSTDVVAALLRRDALARLAAVSPAATLPFEPPPRLVHVLALSTVIALGAFSIGTPAAAPTEPDARRTGAGDAGGPAADNDARAGDKNPETANSAATPPPVMAKTADQSTAPTTSAAAAGTKTGAAPPQGSSPASGDGASRGAEGQLSTSAQAAGAARAGAAAGGAAIDGPAARQAGGISRDGEALPADHAATSSRTSRAGTRLLASGEARASSRSTATADAGDLPPALRAYILRYLESLKR